MNRLKHGLRAEVLLIPGEDPKDLEALRQDLEAQYQPDGPGLERRFAKIVEWTWRQERCSRVHAAIWHTQYYWAEREQALEELAQCRRAVLKNPDTESSAQEEIDELEVDPAKRPAFKAAKKRLAAADKALSQPLAQLGFTYLRSASDLERSARYEAYTNRQLRYAIQDFERFRAHRMALAAEGATLVDGVDLNAPAPAFPKAKAPEAPTVIDVPVDESEDAPVPAMSAAGETAQVVVLSFVDGVALADPPVVSKVRPMVSRKIFSVQGAESQ